MYKPLDEQVMKVHAADILEMTPQQLALDRTRGYYAVNDAPQPHWKYFGSIDFGVTGDQLVMKAAGRVSQKLPGSRQ